MSPWVPYAAAIGDESAKQKRAASHRDDGLDSYGATQHTCDLSRVVAILGDKPRGGL